MTTHPANEPRSEQYSAKGNSYEVKCFGAGPGGIDENAEAVEWLRAVSQGFHGPEPSKESLEKDLAWLHGEGVRLRAVYSQDPVPPAALSDERPVATYCSWNSSLTLGAQTQIPAWLVSEVTVRPTHARRGILRRMMTADLTEAHEAGFAIAALTASEATIYGRFGFGAGTFNTSVAVAAESGLKLKAPSVGRVEMADNKAVAQLAPQIFEDFHELTPGSLKRTSKWWDYVSGQFDWHTGKTDPEVRTAVHYDENDRADGYVSYKFVRGSGFKGTLEVVDLVSPSAQVRIALWEYLCGLDLVTEVRHPNAQMEDPLMWGMVDMADYEVRKRYERLWLRILDPVAALSARPYRSHRKVTVSLVDSLGFADGLYTIDTTGQQTVVERVGDRPRTDDDAAGKSMPRVELPDGADVAMNIDALGSLYLGAVKASTLYYAGLIKVRDLDALDDLQSLMSTSEHPYCISPF
ncbi:MULTISPECIES: GNAT family N-acetyltransferase [Kocuria]|uniref:GNAT family N-acetyltransferase n=1 Tax=Kocuria TaxID=57493 RepID=UPI0021A6046A|nr:GNAT family N-acetyltransferase [Kocuria carniphila]MCT1802865.1 GNAT family N-acetyltransferase [Kocuria carniphila]